MHQSIELHVGASVSPAAYAATGGCRVTARGVTNIVEQDGYAEAGALQEIPCRRVSATALASRRLLKRAPSACACSVFGSQGLVGNRRPDASHAPEEKGNMI